VNSLRSLVVCLALIITGLTSVGAAERSVFEPVAFEAARAAGKPILVHITAPWCGECKQQKPIVAALAETSEFKNLVVFDVDFDTQKNALRQLNVRTQSTLVIFKDGAEVDRAVGITRKEAIESVMRKAL
jgi:thioredoxin-like negative regulator of GroEL